MNKLITGNSLLPIGIGVGILCGFLGGRMTAPRESEDSGDVARKGGVEQNSTVQNRQEIDAEAAQTRDARGGGEKSGYDRIVQKTKINEGKLSNREDLDNYIEKLVALAATDPQGALAQARANLTLGRKDEAVTRLLAAWVRKDPQAAWRWLQANEPGNGQYVDATLGEIGKADPGMAWSLAEEVAQKTPAGAQLAYVSAMQGMIYAGKFEDAIQIIGTGAPGLSGQNDLLTLVGSEWGHYDPAKAIAWAQSLPQGSQEQVLGSVVESWAEVDPKAVADYSASLPEGNLRSMALTQAVNVWVGQDGSKIKEVASWLNQSPGSADASYDPVRYKIATASAGQQDLGTAINWANAIGDDDLRAQALATVITSWSAWDQAGAQDFLQHSTLMTPEMRASVQNRMGGPEK
jgi:hypothetical protein